MSKNNNQIELVKFISNLKNKIINEKYEISRKEAIFLSKIPNNDMETLNILFEAANQIREKFCGENFDLCTIINAKSGKCSENCKYCAQSIHFKTAVDVYGLISKETALREAERNENEGAHRFSLVTSGRGFNGNEKELNDLAEIYESIREHTDKLSLCASHGICTKEALQKLANAGISMYHHNLETSRRFYPNVCSNWVKCLQWRNIWFRRNY